ncbi:MAG: NAD(P)/FAD-dependent oxidoreductase [Candidatus Zixiibacteriota bacterium]
MNNRQPIYDLIIVGAGPAGLEMALAAAELDLNFLVLERDDIAANIRSWGHVRLFSPWSMNVSPRGRQVSGIDISAPDAICAGNEFVENYLEPLAQSAELDDRVKTGVQVIKIGRKGAYKNTLIGDPRRAGLPFMVLADARGNDGKLTERQYLARSVVDASGVYGAHRWLGPGGIPCPGERRLSGRISYLLEDVSARGNEFDGKNIALVGDGYSACAMLESFAELQREGCDLRVTWVVSSDSEFPIQLIMNDPLMYRNELGGLANRMARRGSSEEDYWLRYLRGATVVGLEGDGAGGALKVSLETGESDELEILSADYVYAMIGYTPDRTLYEELQVHECWATSGPMKMASSLLAQAGADCLSVKAGGAETLQNPEPGFYIIGAKSYGRHSNFLIVRLREQVKIVSELMVDHLKSARPDYEPSAE